MGIRCIYWNHHISEKLFWLPEVDMASAGQIQQTEKIH